MNKKGVRLVSAALALIMVLGCLVVMPFTASASESITPVESITAFEGNVPEIGTEFEKLQFRHSEYKKEGTEPSLADDGFYLVSNEEEFRWMLTNSANASYKFRLMANFDINGKYDNTLGLVVTLAAELDGNGKTITGAKLRDNTVNGNVGFGLFRKVTGSVYDLVIYDVSLMGSNGSYPAAGIFTGELGAGGRLDRIHVRNCHASYNTVGGVVGRVAVGAGNTATVTNCTVDDTYLGIPSNASNTIKLGGIVGAIDSGNPVIEDCTNNATLSGITTTEEGFEYSPFTDLSAFTAYMGGIVGWSNSGTTSTITVKSCTNLMDVTLPKPSKNTEGYVRAGGILGYMKTNVTIEGCVNRGAVTSVQYKDTILGGILGLADDTSLTMTDCINYCDVKTAGYEKCYAGGLAGCAERNVTMTGCVNYGSVLAGNGQLSCAGGLVGTSPDADKILLKFISCANYGAKVNAVSSRTDTDSPAGRAGGIIGSAGAGNASGYTDLYVYNCVQTSDVIANQLADAAGGVLGYTNIGHVGSNVAGMQVQIYSSLILGSAHGRVASGGVIGFLYPSGTKDGARHVDMVIENSVIGTIRKEGSTTSVPHGEGAIFGKSAKEGGSTQPNTFKFSNVIIRVEDRQPLNYAGHTYPANEITEEYTLFAEEMLTNGTIHYTLNNYAVENGYTPWAQDKTSPVFVTMLGISGASMSLGESMTLNLKLDGKTLSNLKNVKVYVVKDGVKTEAQLVETTMPDGEARNCYTVAISDIDAADLELASDYSLVIEVNGTEYASTNVLTYAPLDYAFDLYEAKADDQKVASVVTNMVNYAYQAELYADSATAAIKTLAEAKNAAWAEAGKTFSITVSDTVEVIETEDTYYGKNDDSNAKEFISNFVDVGFDAKGNVTWVFKKTDAAAAATSMRLTSTAFKGEVVTLTFNEAGIASVALNAASIRNGIKVEFLDAEGNAMEFNGATQTTYSYGGYLKRLIVNTPEVASFASSMVNYMMAVRAYAKPMAD